MKNTLRLIILSAAAMLFGLTSCQKDQQQPGTLTGSMESLMDKDSKVVFDGSTFVWQEGDKIKVYRHDNSAVKYGNYIATVSSDRGRAEFTPVPGNNEYDVTDDNTYFGEYWAGYPSNSFLRASFNATYYYITGLTVTLPATYYTNEDGGLLGFPMFAKSSSPQSKFLPFKHICGMLRLQLQKSNTKIVAVKVTSQNNVISGSGTASISGGTPSFSFQSSASGHTVTVNFGTPIDLTNSATVFVPLPQGNYSDLVIEIKEEYGGKCTKTQHSGVLHIERSMYSTISLGENDLPFSTVTIQGAKGGLFSVSSNKQVRFSQGNLQYLASSTTWSFAANQYDICPTDNASANRYPSDTSTRWMDLFGWGTSGYGSSLPTNYLMSATYGPISDGLTGDSSVYDWGNKAISNGGNQPGQWRTLTSGEWSHLSGGRNNAANKKALAIVNGQRGLVLLPDAWPETGEPLHRGTSSSWTDNAMKNEYTDRQWAELETRGAIFLPQNGYRKPSSTGTTSMYRKDISSNVNYILGDYWAANVNSSKKPFVFQFNGGGSTSNANLDRYNGCFVRLVHDID